METIEYEDYTVYKGKNGSTVLLDATIWNWSIVKWVHQDIPYECDDDSPGKYWTTPEAWSEYKQSIKEYQLSKEYMENEKRLLYGTT